MSTARPRRWCSRNGFGICFLTRRVLASSDALDFLGFFLLEAPPEPGVLASFGEQAALRSCLSRLFMICSGSD